MIIEPEMRELIARLADVDPARVVPEASFESDLVLDSLERVEFIMKLEEKLGVRIPDKEAGKLKTVGELVALIQSIPKP